MNLPRTLAAALAIAALAAPAAQARPADATRSSTAKNQQDARPHKRVGAYTPGSVPAVSYPSGQNAAPARPVPGPPTWPVGPKPLTPAPADEGNGLDGTTTALGIAGCLLAVCGIGAAVQYRRTRRAQRVSVAA